MTEQVLARKWRPTQFQDLIGQDHVRQALNHALSSGRLHHAYLFTGTRGVGKTTIARILARCLNCETGVTPTPCGTCAACTSITQNRFVDLIEVDAASRTKVDDTRELLENVSYAPVMGRYKVYLIDEVHMLTTQSFNALLKTLEEPPAHVVFLLATTDPHKLLPTVLSRCLQFHLRDLSADQIQPHLAHVLTEEAIAFEPDALWHLARAGRGSMRDAMTLLDQAIAFCQGSVSSAAVVDMLGVQGVSDLPNLLHQVAVGDGAEALSYIATLSTQTPDWIALTSGLQALLHQVAVSQIAPAAVAHLPPAEQRQIQALAEAMAPEFVQLAYQFCLTGYRDLPLAHEPRAAFEMMVLRMLAFRPARANEAISDQRPTPVQDPHRSEPRPAPSAPSTDLKGPGDSVPTADPSSSHPPSAQPVTAITAAESLDVETEPVAMTAVAEAPSETLPPLPADDSPPWDLDETPGSPSSMVPVGAYSDALGASGSGVGDEVAGNSEPAPVVEAVVSAPAKTDTDPSGSAGTEATGAVSVQQTRAALTDPRQWPVVYAMLGCHGLTGSLLRQTVLVSASPKQVVLACLAHTARLLSDSHRERIAQAFGSVFEETPAIVIETRDTLGETPESHVVAQREAALAAAREQFEADPVVQWLMAEAGGRIKQDSIQPREQCDV